MLTVHSNIIGVFTNCNGDCHDYGIKSFFLSWKSGFKTFFFWMLFHEVTNNLKSKREQTFKLKRRKQHEVMEPGGEGGWNCNLCNLMTLFLPHRLHSSAPHTRPGAVCVGRVWSAVCSAPDWDLPEDAGGRAHAAVPPPGAPPPPALLQQRAAPAGDPGGGEEGAPLSPALWFVGADFLGLHLIFILLSCVCCFILSHVVVTTQKG